jgi:ParB family chromosome partitioning protein
MNAQRGLGRGLGALLNDGIRIDGSTPQGTALQQVPVKSIRRNRLQPRRRFEPGALEDLAASIREHGVLQPLLVRAAGADAYELIAGERRLRAAIEAGLESVPILVMEAADTQALELALIENLQREDLNPIEEAEGYRVLGEKFSLTQEQISQRVGKARATVANALRLLKLPDEVRQMLAAGTLSAGHAKAITGLDIPAEQVLLARRVVQEGLSVRQVEKQVDRAHRPRRKPRAVRSDLPQAHLRDLSDRLHTHFGTSVRIAPSRTYANGKKGKGTIEIDFYSNDDLDRLLGLLGIELD